MPITQDAELPIGPTRRGSLTQKIREMRNAIDAIDLALHGDVDWEKKRTLFEDARDDLKIKVEMTVQDLRQLCEAKDECNRIINSPEFAPAELEI